MSNHAWCSDIPRDEAVRAAEDGRSGPPPTLEEAISRAGQFVPPEAPQGQKCTERDNGLRTERVVPPAPESRPAETRQTQAERIGGGWWFPKYDLPSPPPPPPPAPPQVHRGSGVFDANGDEVPWEGVVAMLTDERDAAIRERDELRGERDKAIREREEFRRSFHWSEEAGTRLLAERNASFDDADGLRARVAELESVPAASGNSQAILDGLGSTPPSAAGTELPTE